jgi:hypothetical protein
MAVAVALFVSYANAQLMEPATYTQMPVAGVWGKQDYLNGPASGAMIHPESVAMDASGNIYTYSAEGSIRVMDAATQRVWNLAGMGSRGYKDGPAQSAMFSGGGGGYLTATIAVDSNGAVYVADGYNKAIRKIWKDPSHGYQWWVSTLATFTSGPTAVAVDSYGNVWTQMAAGIKKITQSGVVTSYPSLDQNGQAVGLAMGMAADSKGNVYSITRSPFFRIYKIAPSGSVTNIAGFDWDKPQVTFCRSNDVTFKQETVPTSVAVNNIWFNPGTIKGYYAASVGADEIKAGEWEPLYMVDGPAANAISFQATHIAVTPDGTTVYWGNGDESNLRRLKNGYVMTLYRDGWHTNTCLFEGRNSYHDWILGGPMWATADGTIYLSGFNPPAQLSLRKIVPVP